MGDNSQNLELWSSTLHNLWVASQVGGCPFQVSQLLLTSLRHLGCSPFLLGSGACLCFFQAAELVGKGLSAVFIVYILLREEEA